MLFPSAKIIGRGRLGKPFSLSGSWENGNDGWEPKLNMRRLSVRPRTGSFSMTENQSLNGAYVEYPLGGEVAKFTRVSVSIWFLANAVGGNKQINMAYKSGSSNFVQFATVSNSDQIYLQLLGSFDHRSRDNLIISIGTPQQGISLDDWSITGTPL